MTPLCGACEQADAVCITALHVPGVIHEVRIPTCAECTPSANDPDINDVMPIVGVALSRE